MQPAHLPPPNARSETARPPNPPKGPQPALTAPQADHLAPAPTSRPSRYYSWPELMRRVFQVDVLRCPRCNAGPMRILAAIHPPTNTRAILQSLGLPTRAPPLTPARSLAADWTLAEPCSAGSSHHPAA